MTGTRSSAHLVWLVAAGLCAATASAADLCQGVPVDKQPHPMTPLAKPALRAAVIDPDFGTTLRRITAVPPGGANPVMKPLYSTVSAWNADESRLILYHVGSGHELYDGRSYRFLRALDIDPVEIEQVYWHTTDPNLLFYVSSNRLIRYHVREQVKEVVHDFASCSGTLSAGPDPMFTSWGSDVIGLKCGTQAFFYRIHDDQITGVATTSLPAPQAAAGGGLGFIGGYVVDLGMNALRRLDLANPYEHASLGRLASGEDAHHAVAFDPGPLGSGVGSLVTSSLQTGASRVIVGPSTGYPYPPSGTHVSALAYRQPGWTFLSIVGDPAGQGVLDNELVIADTNTGRVCRAAHHRSWGRNNTQLADPYWAEPQVVPSPRGTRAVFASDWGNGPTVDAYVLELPTYRRFTASLAPNRTQYTTGERLTLSVGLSNPGLPTRVDLYLIALRPDGQQLVALTPAGAVAGALSNPAGWPALARGLDLSTPFEYLQPAFFSLTWNGGEDPGTYRFVLMAVEPGSLTDDRIDTWDVWSVAAASVTFAP
jgi:hypothetical protein